MRALYIDCFSGLAGDMFLGALFDLAEHLGEADRVNPRALHEALKSLKLPHWEFQVTRVQKHGISGIEVSVCTPWGIEEVVDLTEDDKREHSLKHEHEQEVDEVHTHEHTHEHTHNHTHEHTHEHSHEHAHGLTFKEVIQLIQSSDLDQLTVQRALKVFTCLGEAEARAHDLPIDDVHFHEVGMIDSIVDIVGVAWCLTQLNVTKITSAPPPVNRGWVRCAHGVMPLPAPATAHLLEGLPTITSTLKVELITPTGAALIKAFAEDVSDQWPSRPSLAVGWGAGKRNLSDRPNLVRVVVSDLDPEHNVPACVILSCNLDDLTPEHLASTCQLLLDRGALDVWQTPILMKKGRGGVQLNLLCDLQKRIQFETLILRHTTTLGVRGHKVTRVTLPRYVREVDTPWGQCSVKISLIEMRHKGEMSQKRWRVKPEHDQVVRLSRHAELSTAELSRWVTERAYQLIDHEWGEQLSSTLDEEEKS